MTFYSQHGEDIIIDAAFAGRATGYFVEVGCIDGRRFSNTLSLEERGWRGMCLEAHPDYIDLVRANRPRSTVVHCAAAERDEVLVDFYANARGALSTLERSREAEFAARFPAHFAGFETRRVPMRSVSSLLDEHGVAEVDVLSIDVDGGDERVLAGLDLTRHRPELIVIEADTGAAADAIDGILLPAGYERGFSLSTNVFYFRETERLARVRGRTFQCRVVHTRHPLDQGEDEVRNFTHRL